ncbi:GNAT family N-acetyltransferase [Demequina oxidasica]|uniref:GNAT family N-acetyltransferase n=1 Tax=Demequina oxidasica TaxID=676199 RepID=UPI0007830B29|nr:GNAT family N-acetyltransferase [Demequina oxidasica]
MPAMPRVVPHRIVTERVAVRAYEVTDAEAMDAAMAVNHVRLREWMPWAWDEPQSIETRRNLLAHFRTRFDAGEDFTMGMFDRSSGALLGGTGLHPRAEPGLLEIGYWLAADAEGRGLMREVAAALTQVALGVAGADRVQVCCDPANTRSRGVPQSLDYARVGVRTEPPGAEVGRELTEVWAMTAVAPDSPVTAFPRPSLADADGEDIAWPA